MASSLDILGVLDRWTCRNIIRSIIHVVCFMPTSRDQYAGQFHDHTKILDANCNYTEVRVRKNCLNELFQSEGFITINDSKLQHSEDIEREL